MGKEYGEKIKMILLVTSIAANISLIRNTDLENLYGNQEIFIKGIIFAMKGKAMEKCILQMVLYIKGLGKEDSRQVKPQ